MRHANDGAGQCWPMARQVAQDGQHPPRNSCPSLVHLSLTAPGTADLQPALHDGGGHVNHRSSRTNSSRPSARHGGTRHQRRRRPSPMLTPLARGEYESLATMEHCIRVSNHTTSGGGVLSAAGDRRPAVLLDTYAPSSSRRRLLQRSSASQTGHDGLTSLRRSGPDGHLGFALPL
jgi:hypothetical protein